MEQRVAICRRCSSSNEVAKCEWLADSAMVVVAVIGARHDKWIDHFFQWPEILSAINPVRDLPWTEFTSTFIAHNAFKVRDMLVMFVSRCWSIVVVQRCNL